MLYVKVKKQATYKVKDVFGNVTQHAREGGPQNVLHASWPSSIFAVFLKVI